MPPLNVSGREIQTVQLIGIDGSQEHGAVSDVRDRIQPARLARRHRTRVAEKHPSAGLEPRTRTVCIFIAPQQDPSSEIEADRCPCAGRAHKNSVSEGRTQAGVSSGAVRRQRLIRFHERLRPNDPVGGIGRWIYRQQSKRTITLRQCIEPASQRQWRPQEIDSATGIAARWPACGPGNASFRCELVRDERIEILFTDGDGPADTLHDHSRSATATCPFNSVNESAVGGQRPGREILPRKLADSLAQIHHAAEIVLWVRDQQAQFFDRFVEVLIGWRLALP